VIETDSPAALAGAVSSPTDIVKPAVIAKKDLVMERKDIS
jgi:hypothetical protein